MSEIRFQSLMSGFRVSVTGPSARTASSTLRGATGRSRGGRVERMGVPCPRCGRKYDVALFQFGRTIDCTCGSRVGLEPRVRPAAEAGEVRFPIDAMLGRLARWLRIIGYDASYDSAISDAELARSAFEEDRVVLTRDRALPEEWRLLRVLVLESEVPLEQLREVVRSYGLDWRVRPFSRCNRCNVAIEPATRETVADRVPSRVIREQREFFTCPACARVYWEGSHLDRMRCTLEDGLGNQPDQ